MKPKHVQAKFEAYLLTEKCVSQNTFDAYKRDIDQFMQFLQQEEIAIEKIKKSNLKKFLRFLHDLKISPRSISRKISTLKIFFSWAHRQFDWKNYAQELHFPKIEKKLPQYLSEQEIKHLFAIAQQDQSPIGRRNKIMLYLMYVSGMRVSELTHLTVSDIHFDTGFIAVTGKAGKQRMIPIPQPMLAMIKKYIQAMQQIFKCSAIKDADYLFPVQYGKKIKPITRQACWGIIKKLCKKSAIERSISPHQLRHSLATHMLQKGADLRSLQLLLGHENITTVQVYTHVETTHLREVYDKKHPRS